MFCITTYLKYRRTIRPCTTKRQFSFPLLQREIPYNPHQWNHPRSTGRHRPGCQRRVPLPNHSLRILRHDSIRRWIFKVGKHSSLISRMTTKMRKRKNLLSIHLVLVPTTLSIHPIPPFRKALVSLNRHQSNSQRSSSLSGMSTRTRHLPVLNVNMMLIHLL